MKMILMGTGTSHGVPVIGCDCVVCKSQNPKDTRLRCSAYITSPAQIVIDTGPEFRIQALKYHIKHLDAVLITHSHADHLHGLDDLRIFSHTESADAGTNPRGRETEGRGLPIYANAGTVEDIRNRFDYIFKTVQVGGGKPKIDLECADCFVSGKPLVIQGLEILPVPILHGHLKDSGWLLSQYSSADEKKHSIAYLTDCSTIDESSVSLIQESCGILDYLVIDGLRQKPHATHFSFAQALEVAERLRPRHTCLIHITHDMFHEDIDSYVSNLVETDDRFCNLRSILHSGGSVAPAYDGMELKTPE